MKLYKESVGKSKKIKGNSKEKDCLTKKLILETIGLDSITIQDIFRKSGYTGKYETLRGLVLRYQKFGYVAREGKIPYHYFLTDLGCQHLEKPTLGRETAVREYNARLASALVKYADTLDDETVTRIFKDRVVTPTVKNENIVKENVIKENVKVIDSKPAPDLPKPSDGLSGSIDANVHDGSDTVADLLEQVKELKAENEDMARKLAGNSIAKTKNPTDDVPTVRKYDKILLKYKNAVVDNNFFKYIPYKLYLITAIPVDNLGKALKEFIKVKQGDIIILPDIQAKPLVENRFVRRLTDSELKKLQPKLAFGKKKAYILIKSKKLQLELCDLPAEVVERPVKIKAPID
jgi:hypothetical protein